MYRLRAAVSLSVLLCGLYAVVEGPTEASAGAWRPAADHDVVFTPRPGSVLSGVATSMRDSAVAAVELGCRGPAELVQAPDGTPLPSVAVERQPIRATLDVFSGRADNPTWTLSEAQAVSLEAMLAALPEAPAGVPEQGLGYRGFVLELPAEGDSPERRLRVYEGVVWDDGEPTAWLRLDPERQLERWIAAMAPEGVPPEVLEQVEGSLGQP